MEPENVSRFFSFPIIDFHVHLFPEPMFDAIWKAFVKDYGWGVLYRLYAPEILRFLRARGVETMVFSNYAHKAGIASFLNDWNLKLLEQERGLYCFAAFHPGDPDYIKEVARLLRHPRILGFKLQLLVQRFYPHDERLFPMYEAVMDAGKRILMHVGTGPVGNEFVGFEHFLKLLKRYPQLKVNVPHMGESEITPFLDILDEYPGIYLDTAFAFFAYAGRMRKITPDELWRYRNRIVYGSDFPNLIFNWEEEIEVLKSFNLGEEFYRRVFCENGEKLLAEATNK